MKKLRTSMGKRQITPSNAIPGFWVLPFGDHTSIIPSSTSPPTGFVLPETKYKHPSNTFRALDMFPLDGQWRILSNMGVYTYRHSSELMYDHLVLFVPIDEWPNAYQVKMTKPIANKDIKKLFGKEASLVAPALACHGAVCLQLTRFDGATRE